MKKKKTRRSSKKYPALIPEMNLKTRQELIDYDYIDKLSESEKAWLNKFTEEYVGANLDRENFKNNLNNTKEMKQGIDKMNNLRKFDIYTNLKVINMLDSLDDYKSQVLSEEQMAERLDHLGEFDNTSDDSEESDDDGSGDPYNF